MERVVILMGSKADLDFSKEIGKHLENFGIEYEFRIASAHKVPKKLLDILEEYEKSGEKVVTLRGH